MRAAVADHRRRMPCRRDATAGVRAGRRRRQDANSRPRHGRGSARSRRRAGRHHQQGRNLRPPALDQNSAVARKIIEFAKKFGIADKDIQTDSINLAPAYKSVPAAGGGTRQEPDGYTASNMVRVRLTDMARLGTFMRQVLDQGATNINGVHFGLSDPEKSADEARAKAVEDAVRQARLLADAAKVKLGSIQEIVHPPRSEFRGGDHASLRGPVTNGGSGRGWSGRGQLGGRDHWRIE